MTPKTPSVYKESQGKEQSGNQRKIIVWRGLRATMRKRIEATILHLIEVGNNRKRCVNLQRVVEPISNGFQWFHDKTGLERILYLFAINRRDHNAPEYHGYFVTYP
mgnify:FL=1